jgi:release factor glutamine methyltransferase
MNESELLFSSILNCDRPSLYLNKAQILDKDSYVFVSSVLKRRIKGEPIQYILGKTEFMGFVFKLSPDVLIPRPETEILVEAVINKVTKSQGCKVTNIFDIGTGSGCIAISLAKILTGVKITALDFSQKALKVARDNAQLHNVASKIKFICGDLFSGGKFKAKSYDIIVSNPPYIVSDEIDNLAPEIQYEPRMALDGGKDGLDFYRRIICGSLEYLKNDGLLILEIGFNQGGALKNIFQKHKDFEIIEIIRDYHGIERVVLARKKKLNG